MKMRPNSHFLLVTTTTVVLLMMTTTLLTLTKCAELELDSDMELNQLIQDSLDDMIRDLEDRYSDFEPDEFFHPNVYGTGNENREVVHLKDVERLTVNLGSNYQQWKYARVGLKHYLIGMSEMEIHIFGTDLKTIATFQDQELESSGMIQEALSAFTRWNEMENRVEMVILIATSEPRLNLYEFKDNRIFKVGSFPLHYGVESIEICHVGTSSKVVLIPKNNLIDIDVYNIEVTNSTQIWFFQRIPISSTNDIENGLVNGDGGASVVVYSSDMLDSVIAISEGNQLIIFSYDVKGGLFDIYQRIEMPSPCRHLFTFTHGYTHYIGCVPLDANQYSLRFISYNYNTNEYNLEEQDSNFGAIRSLEVYPIAMPDYTDQYYLLVRDEDNVLRIFIYHGVQAGFKEESKCGHGGDNSNKIGDVRCQYLKNLSRGVGFRQDDQSTFIFPSNDTNGLTDIWIITNDVQDFLSPLVEESRQLYNNFRELSTRFEDWDKTIIGVQKTLNDSLDPSSQNTINGSWYIEHLHSSEYKSIGDDEDSSKYNAPSQFSFMGQDWEDEDFQISESTLEKDISSLNNILASLSNQLGDALMSNSESIQFVRGTQRVESPNGYFNAHSIEISNARLGSIADTTDALIFFNSLLLQSNDLKIQGSLIFENGAMVKELRTEKLNELLVKNIARYGEENRISCPTQFAQGLKVKGHLITEYVNGINLKKEIMMIDDIQGLNFTDGLIASNNTQSSGNYSFEQVMLKSTEQIITSRITFTDLETSVPLKVDYLDDEDFSTFLSSVITRDFNGIIMGAKNFTQISTNSLKIGSTWNQRLFPTDFIKNKQGRLVLHGEKSFGFVKANKVSINGLLDGKNVGDLIPRNAPMTINNTWVFKGPVKVIKDLPVTGLVDGVDLDKLSHKGNLLEYYPAYEAYGDVEFENEVSFTELNVLQSINHKRFQDIFGDLLLFNSSNCYIPGRTTVLSSIQADSLSIANGLINGKMLNNFLTSNGNQNISVDVTLSAPCQFNRLYALGGRYDGVELRDLFESAIRITGHNSQITWPMDFEHLVCGELGMVTHGGLNEFQNLWDSVALTSGKKSQSFLGDVSFDKLQANHAVIGELNIPQGGKLSGVDIIQWNENRRSLSNDELINDPVVFTGYVKSSYDIFTSILNSISMDRLFNESFKHKPHNILDAEQKHQQGQYIHSQTVKGEWVFQEPLQLINGNITFQEDVNGYSLNQLVEEGFPLHEQGEYEETLKLYGNWHFESIKVQESLTVDGLTCSVDIKELVADSVLKPEYQENSKVPLYLGGRKRFNGPSPISVGESLVADTINGKVLQETLFTLDGNQTINCGFESRAPNMKIEGPLSTDGYINDQVHINQISSIYSNGDEGEDHSTHVIQGDYTTDYNISASNLHVQGLVQGQDFSSMLDNLIWIDSMDELQLSERKTFKSPVTFGKHCFVNLYNEIELSAEEFKILRLNDKEVRFLVPVEFPLGDTHANGGVLINGANVKVWEEIVGVDWEQMVNGAIIKGEDLGDRELGNMHFDSIIINGKVTADRIQGERKEDLILLKDHGNVIPTLNVKKLEIRGEDLQANRINGWDLNEEFRRTVMKNKDEYSSPLVLTGKKTFLGTIHVKENFNCFGPTFQDDVIDITKPFNISKPIELLQPVRISKSLNVTKPFRGGYTVDSIMSGALTHDDDEPISGEWEFNKGVTFKDDVEGDGELHNFDLKGLLEEKDYQLRAASSRIQKQKDKYQSECLRIHNATEELVSNPMKLDAFDKHQSIRLKKRVEKVIVVQSSGRNLLLTSSSSCEVMVYRWAENTELFHHDLMMNDLHFGRVLEWESSTHSKFGLVLFQLQHSDCSSRQSGLYFILIEPDGNFSPIFTLHKEPILSFKMITDPYEKRTVVFVLQTNQTMTIFSWDDDNEDYEGDDGNVKGFKEVSGTSPFPLTHPYDRIEVSGTSNGVGILLIAEDHIQILHYNWKGKQLKEIAEERFLTSRVQGAGLFESYGFLYALVPAKEIQIQESKGVSNIQLFQVLGNRLLALHQLPVDSTLSKCIMNFVGGIYVSYLSPVSGLNIYVFKGLSGLIRWNENPIKIFNGIELRDFEVKAWDYSTPRPFIMALTTSSIEIFHSNIFGDSLDYNSKNLCKIK